MTSSRLDLPVRPPRAPWDPGTRPPWPGSDPRRWRDTRHRRPRSRSERRRRVDGDDRVRHRGGGRGRADRKSHGRRVVPDRGGLRGTEADSPERVSLAGSDARIQGPTRRDRIPRAGVAGGAAWSADPRGRLPGQDRRAARRRRAAADQRGRVPRCVVLAARPRGAGAAPDSLGPRALGGGRHGDQADPVDRADGAGAGRRTRALVARGAGSSGAAAWDADDRVLPGADRNDCQGRAGARDPDCGSGRRPARTRARNRWRQKGRGRGDRARGPGPRRRRGDSARRAQPRSARPHVADGVRSLRPSGARERSRPRTPPGTVSPRRTPGRSASTRGGTITAPTGPCT